MISSLVVSLLLLVGTTKNDSVLVERLGIKGPIVFEGASYHLAWTNTRDSNFYIQEYIPESEQLETYTHMLTVKLLQKETPLSVVTLAKMNELEERKKTDEFCQYALIETADSKEYLLDFITSEKEGKETKSASFNIYRYRQIEISGKPALLQLAYTERAAGNAAEAMLQSVSARRVDLLNAMVEMEMPAVSL